MKIIISFFILSLTYASNLNLELKNTIQAHENIVASRIQDSIQLFFQNTHDLTVKVNAIHNEENSAKKVSENAPSYLPLTLTDVEKASHLKIKVYNVKVLSRKELESFEKEKLNKIIKMELGQSKFFVDYDQIESSSIPFISLSELKAILFNSDMWKFALSFGFMFMSFSVFIRTKRYYKKLEKSKLQGIHESQIYELISFVKTELKKNQKVLELCHNGSREDWLGLKGLLVYLMAEYSPKEILSGASVLNIHRVEGSFDESQFGIWLREFSERIAVYDLKGVDKSSFSILEEAKTKRNEEFIWKSDNLHLLPSVYIMNKLKTKTVDELSGLVKYLPARSKLHLLDHLEANVADKVMQLSNSVEDDKVIVVGEFIKEVQCDYNENLFYMSERDVKKAS